jgi:phage protein D
MAGLTYTLLIDDRPASSDVIEAVQELEVDDSMDRASAFRIRLAIGSDADGDWSLLADDLFRPLTPVSVKLGIGTSSESLIKAYVTAVDALFEESPGGSYLEVTGVDASVRMNLEEKVRGWPNLSDGDIAERIFAEYGLDPEVTTTSPNRSESETTTTQRGTDIRFLRRLAARNGYACYVETDPVSDTETGVFAPLDLAAQAQGVLSVRFGEAGNVERFSARYEMVRPTTAEAGGVGIAGRSVETAQVSSTSETELGADGTLEAITPQPLVRPSGTGLDDAGELQRYCQAVADRSSWAITATGWLQVGAYGRALRARRPVAVRGAGSLYSGTYLVRRVLHTFSGEQYTQQFELSRNALGLTGSESFRDAPALASVG